MIIIDILVYTCLVTYYWFLKFQKLEEKFKATERENQKAEERSVEKEESKLRQRLCFKAKPLPNFYKKRPKSTDQTKKVSSLSPKKR